MRIVKLPSGELWDIESGWIRTINETHLSPLEYTLVYPSYKVTFYNRDAIFIKLVLASLIDAELQHTATMAMKKLT